ncbi:MAG: transcriptional regulator, partial [Alphaproteobacteria bacterium]|nr:transcriptional regulator [Alphaproteobacteria bacterium]
LGWSGSDLAEICDVSLRTISKIETFSGLPDARVATLVKLQSALEAAGIEFIGTPDNAPGIRIHARPPQSR